MSDIKAYPSKLIDVGDIPSDHNQILAIYAHKNGFAIAIEERFQDVLRAEDGEVAAQMVADILECLRRSLNTARGVA